MSELERKEGGSRRRIRRFERRPEANGGNLLHGSGGQSAGGNHRWSRQHENDTGGQRRAVVLAAGHRAIHRCRLRGTGMFAVGMRVGGGGSLWLGSGRVCVAVQRAHAIGTTGHSVSLPSGGPQWRPEEKDGQQTHAGAQPVSRSDGAMERMSHWANPLMLARGRAEKM
jgi:hypothetical protein